MPRTLYLTTELPYFPGQGGLMALLLRSLAADQVVGVVGPRYPHQPESALQSLRDGVTHSYWWPEHASPGPLPASAPTPIRAVGFLAVLPKRARRALLLRLTNLHRYSDDAPAWRAVLVNLAPKLLEALQDQSWNTLLLSQSTSAGWLPYLPKSLATCLVLHDIRSDYLRRAPQRLSRYTLQRIQREESAATSGADALMVLSTLDRDRAVTQLRPNSPITVVPLCVDPGYFSYDGTATDAPPVVLFTGHLSHPPNVDAALHFMAAIWPRVRSAMPAARFRLVGLQPDPRLAEEAARTPGVELLANVPDIRPLFRQSRLYVVPMRYGGGVRQKILEAWAMGLPVVSTRMGLEGIAAIDGQHCWCRDEPNAFADEVIRLLREPAPPALLAAARAQVESHHSPAVSGPLFRTVPAIALGRRRQGPPRVLFDLRWLKPGQVGGIEQMTRELIEELIHLGDDCAYRFWGGRDLFRRWRFAPPAPHHLHPTDGLRAKWVSWRDAAALALSDSLGSPPLVSPELSALECYTRLDFTLVHGLAGHVHPDLRRFPSVVTVHDLQHLHLPELFSAEDIATREREYRESCNRASHVICISEFTRQDVHRRYGLPLEKISTIWNLPPAASAVPLARPVLRRRLHGMGIKDRFLFFPSAPWRHKNHLGLLQAWQEVRSGLPTDHKLVLTGQPLSADHPATGLLSQLEKSGSVVHLGYRSPGEIHALYQAADAMIFPSLFEGFGLPLVEAMQQSCPIVCGEHTALPEIAGDAAHYADVSNPGAMAKAIREVVGNESLRARLRNAAAVNLRRFDRRHLAEKTRGIYAAVHARHFS